MQKLSAGANLKIRIPETRRLSRVNIRVSTDHQTHDAQRDALQALGVSRIFADKMSGARDDRTGYRALLD